MRLAPVLVLAVCLYVGARPVGPLPPLGPFLDPANGVWAVASTSDLPSSGSVSMTGLREPVNVVYDDRAVPHIFATTPEDAYRALGYVVARDRLFQLELQTLAASGRLTEIAGVRALDADRETRSLGMTRAAEQKWKAIDTASATGRAVIAFAAGVNTWINGLRPRDLPLEFRLMGRRPSRWEPINSIHLLNRMGRTLAYHSGDAERQAASARVGRAAAELLFPMNSPIQEPIQPNGQTTPRLDTEPLPPPGLPDTQAILARTSQDYSPDGNVIGSNNWAVSPQRTKAGFALLAGDPHLELTLPSIWYEVHLVVPGAFDVYGVTIPGAPGVIIGFNRDIAWTFTNTGADVTDHYLETVDDTASPRKYLLDGAWQPLQFRTEIYRSEKGEVIATDTLRFTHRGPLSLANGRWMSMRWTVLDVSNEMDAFRRAALAHSVSEFQEAMSSYVAAAQNMLVADREGNIAIRSTGRFPIRPGNGLGNVVRDGSTRVSDWQGYWPLAEYPQSVNPRQGFLASANQQPIDPAVSPRYMGDDWPSPWRAMRINALLRADSAVTPDAMRRFQTDPGNAKADLFVPMFLAAARRNSGSANLIRAAELLAQWDRLYTRDNERAVLFEYALDEMASRLWDELGVPSGQQPGHAIIAKLLRDSASVWWDDRRTAESAEQRDDILAAALEAGFARAVREHGDPAAGGWRWDRIRHININHLLRMPSLSALRIPVQGGPSTLNPAFDLGTHGASWRMVVELGPEVRAWGTYPGGQSGNPASSRYTDRLPKWSSGELDSLRFPRRAKDLRPDQTKAFLTLTPAR